VKFVLFVLFLFLFLTGLSAAQQWSKEQQEVWAVVQKYWEINESDPLAFLDYFDESYLGWSYNNEAPATKNDAVKTFTYWSKKGKSKLNILTPARIWVSGNYAYVHYYYTEITERNDGTPNTEKGRWTDILMKKDGKWMLVGDHGGEIKK